MDEYFSDGWDIDTNDKIKQWLITGRNSCPLCRGQGVGGGDQAKAETSNTNPSSSPGGTSPGSLPTSPTSEGLLSPESSSSSQAMPTVQPTFSPMPASIVGHGQGQAGLTREDRDDGREVVEMEI